MGYATDCLSLAEEKPNPALPLVVTGRVSKCCDATESSSTPTERRVVDLIEERFDVGIRAGQLEDSSLIAKFWTGQTHVILEPLEFLRRLAALIPPRRFHGIRYHGLFSAASIDRAEACALAPPLDPAHPGRGARDHGHGSTTTTNSTAMTARSSATVDAEAETDRDAPYRKRRRMEWARLLRQVFAVDILRCHCGGERKVIAALTRGVRSRRGGALFIARSHPLFGLLQCIEGTSVRSRRLAMIPLITPPTATRTPGIGTTKAAIVHSMELNRAPNIASVTMAVIAPTPIAALIFTVRVARLRASARSATWRALGGTSAPVANS